MSRSTRQSSRPPRRAHSRAAAGAALLLGAGLLGAGPLGAQSGPPPAPVRVVAAELREMVSHAWVPGTVVSRNDARLAAEVSGQLTWVAEVGGEVARGDVVARIDDSALQLQLKNDDATIRRLEANLDLAEQQVARTERLAAQQIVSANDLEQAAVRRETATQELVAARVARERSQFLLSRTRVRAPFPGKVVERLQQAGGYVAVGAEIVRLVNVESVEITARAPLSVEPFLAEGMPVTVEAKERQATGTVRTVVRVGDERSRMFEVRVALDEGSWVVGSAVRVALPSSAPRQVVAVPRDALVLRSDAVYVFRVTDDGTAERLEVDTGIGDSASIEILGAVGGGDRIVVRGAERLRPGQPVTVTSE